LLKLNISPYSQCINILVFTIFALLTNYKAIIFVQFFPITLSIIIFSMKIKNFQIRDIFNIFPLLFFIFVVNSFRGGGEIIVRFGILLLIKQGMVRGLYYSGIIIELFFMSRLLTGSFSEKQLISVLFTVNKTASTLFSYLFSRKKKFYERKKSLLYNLNTHERINIVFVFYYVFLIFNIAYSEFNLFFKRSKMPVKQRTILFFQRVFKKSTLEYKRIDSIDVKTVYPLYGDYLYCLVQIISCASSVYLKKLIYFE